MFTVLPPEFAALEGRVQWVQQVNSNEYSSSCPNCGIEPKHSDSNPSNRFVMWVESHISGKPFGWCRSCHYKWSSEKSDAIWTPEEKAAFAAKRRELNEREEQRIREYAESVVMKQEIYKRYFETMKTSQYGNEWLRRKGFNSHEWNSYFGFGIFEDYKCRGEFSTYYSPAITMPIRGVGNVIEQVKLRVAEAKHKNDRFRNIYKTNAQHPYFPMKNDGIKNKVAIFEGEMKSCQVAMRGNLPEDVQIIATQGKGLGGRMLYMLENCEVVYLCLDPDTYEPDKNGETTIMKVSKRIGFDRTRIIQCRDKIDDAILNGFNLLSAYNMAVKPIQLGVR